MQTATSIQKTKVASETPGAQTKAKKPRPISWETFEKKYLTREDGNTYEWSNGFVLISRNSMGPSQLYIHRNLIALFRELLYKKKIQGELLAETDLFFAAEVHKRPDFAWLTNQQINRLSVKNAIEIPAFIIEVISNHDVAQKLTEKLQLYRATGVQVVWLIFPNQEEIHVYSGKNLEEMTVCTGEKICSAAPAIPAFTFKAKAVFEKSGLQQS